MSQLTHNHVGHHPLTPGTQEHAAATSAWNRLTVHRPAAVFAPADVHDVAHAVRWAVRQELGVAVMATGHGVAGVGEHGVLINTASLRSVCIDAARRTATVGAGAHWSDVLPACAPHGLVGICGSSSQVGVVGFTQGGGFGWLSRSLGFASSSVRGAELVTASGRVRTLRRDRDDDLDLLWGVAGGAGNFGVVTSLTLDLHPIRGAYAGSLYYPVDRASEVIATYASWSASLPADAMSALALSGLPDAPSVPEPFRGRRFVVARGCFPDLAAGEDHVHELRRQLGDPDIDTWTKRAATDLDGVSLDPTSPLPFVQRGESLTDITDEVTSTLQEHVIPHLGTSLVMCEMRQLGGAMDTSPRGPHPMADTSARFSINCIGVAPTPDAVAAVRTTQERIFTSLRLHLTGDTYLNFLDGDATPERVRAAYTPQDWERLVALKNEHDPHNVLRFNRNIPPHAPSSIPSIHQNGAPS